MTTSSAVPPRTLAEDLRALLTCPRELGLVYAATTLEYVGVYSFLSTLALWLTGDFHLTDPQAGWWAATFSTLISLFAFLIGSVADVLGVRTTLVISFGLAATLRTVMATAHTTSVALAALVAFAVAFASGSPVLQTAVHRYSTPATRPFAFSFFYVALNVGGVISGTLIDAIRAPFLDASTHKLVPRLLDLPLFGPTEVSAYRAIMGVGTISAALAFAVTLLLRPAVERRAIEGQAAPPPRKNPLRVLAEVVADVPFWRFMLLLSLLALVKMMFQHMHFTWPKYVTRELGETFPWGKVWSLNSLLVLGLAPLATALTRRRRIFDVLVVGALVSALSPFILCMGSSYPYQITMIVVLTMGEALWSPRSYEYTLSIAPPGRESTYVSLAALPYFLAKFLVGPTSGYLLAAFCPESGPRTPAIMWAIIGGSTMLGPLGILAFRKVIEGGRPSPDYRNAAASAVP